MTGGAQGHHPRRILTVCLGNYCRSPVAACILTHHGGAGLEIRSAGIRDKWAGQPAHPLMIEAAAAHGYDLTGHRAAQVTTALLEWADLVLAMDLSNVAALCDLATPRTRSKVRLYLPGKDVPDPWGRPRAAFDHCLTVLENGADRYVPRTAHPPPA
ncbi:low molecular weight protein-tyrosine-phosphatase [Streptomyces sp. NPDC058308]|uniref:low molecular weight protein-tyrosine-phosphatase n=1 Tax=Streptomyces sp. NPDC058308 TaxID=3346440 RepID=UPI0036E8637E